jgi:hypothetical protein
MIQHATAMILFLICSILVTTTDAAFVPSSVVSPISQSSPSIARLSRQVGTWRHDRWRLLLSEQPQQPPSETTPNNNKEPNKLPFFLDPNTKGGVVVLTVVLFIIPVVFYKYITENYDVEEADAGRWIGAGFTLVATLLWTSTYIFRVANKGMTYVSDRH